MRDEVRGFVGAYIRRRATELVPSRPHYVRYAFGVRSGEIKLNELWGKLDKETEGVLRIYDGSLITFDFTFDIKENNSSDNSLDVVSSFMNGSDKVGLTAAADLKRENIRNLRVRDTFAQILNKFPDDICNDRAPGPNPIYPITGKIDLQDTVYTFLSLNQSGNLDAMKDTGTSPAISDNIKFITKFSAGVNPSYSLTRVGRVFRAAGGMFKMGSTREDTHQVIVVMSLPLSGIGKVDKPTARTIAERRIRDDAEIDRSRQIDLINSVSRLADRLQ